MSGGVSKAALAGGLAVALGLGAAGALLLRPGDGLDADRVRAVLLENPEIIPEAMTRLQAREAGRAIQANRAALERPYAGAWMGAEDGDVTLVQFFDYACGYCRASLPVLDRLVREDPGLKVVFREFPILGQPSVAAAEASLAAATAGRYRAFHDRLYAAGRPTPESIAATARATSTPTTEAGARAEIENNYRLATMLGINATPAWVIGDQALSGAVGYDALKAAIAEARSGRAG